LSGHALEFVISAVIELEPGPDHKVAQRAGYKHIVRPRQCAHACADVHADPTDIVAPDLAPRERFTDVYAAKRV
jgi:hypothetical protein